jgi:hypothetical protein
MSEAMMSLRIVILLSLGGWSRSFLSPSTSRERSAIADRSANAHDADIARVQSEFSDLKKQLFDTKDIKMKAEDVVQMMLEKAQDLAAFQKYKQEEIFDKANVDFRHAHADLEAAHILHESAAREACGAEREVAMVESVDDAYEDKERARELAVAHAAQKLEKDARDLEVNAQFQEWEAEAERAQAAEILAEFEKHEKDLKGTLQELQNFRRENLLKTWAAEGKSRVRDHLKETKLTAAMATMQLLDKHEKHLKKAAKELQRFKRDAAATNWVDSENMLQTAEGELQRYRSVINQLHNSAKVMATSQVQGSKPAVPPVARVAVIGKRSITTEQKHQEDSPPESSDYVISLEDTAQVVLEQAIQVAAAQKRKQQEKLLAAVEEYRQAQGDLEQARDMHRRAVEAAMAAAMEGRLLEATDGRAFDDQEPGGNVAFMEAAASHLEQDAQDLEIEAQLHGMEAELTYETAAELLQRYEQHERDLKETLTEVRAFQQAKKALLRSKGTGDGNLGEEDHPDVDRHEP